MNFKVEERKKKDPMGPFIGFVVFILVAGFSFLISGPAVKFLTTTSFRLGSLGQILPIALPATWPPLLRQGVIGGGIFLFLFIIVMIVMFSMMKPVYGEQDVKLADIRAQKEAMKKKR